MMEFDLDPDAVRQRLPADVDDVVRPRRRLACLPDAGVLHATADPAAQNRPFDPAELEWDLPGQTDMAPTEE